MSALYNLEPQPTASAIIHTTLGEIMVELFAKQAPLACRNFLQLSLDGYYDGSIFHRLVPKFILQGGDPTGTGNGGESIYDGGAFSGDLDPWPMDQRHGENAGLNGINFKDEFHSRLKFNRRGLFGMANDGRPDTNGSQFFFTLDRTDELTGKNTLFGRVVGDTIYNLIKISESEVEDRSERPLYPVKIERIEVLINPFEDMKKRQRITIKTPLKSSTFKDQKNKKRKGGKQLLSFDNDEGSEEMSAFKKIKFDTRLITDEKAEETLPQKSKKQKINQSKPKIVSSASKTVPTGECQKATNDDGPRTADKGEELSFERDRSPPETSLEPENGQKSAFQKAQEEIAALKASMRRTVHFEQFDVKKEQSAIESMIPEASMRARKRRPEGQASSAKDDADTLRVLRAFQSRLNDAPPEKETIQAKDATIENQDGLPNTEEATLCDLHFLANCQSCTAWDKQEKEESDDEGWMSHSLCFAAEKLGKNLRNRKKAEEELVIIDPRQKARTIREEKRARIGGYSSRAWDQVRDQARNAKLARAASLTGRGAK